MTMDIRDAVDGGLLLFSAERAVAPDVQQLFQWPAQTGGAEDAGQVDQPGEAAGGVGAAGEAEQVDLVAGVVVVTEKAEAVDDVGIQSCSAEAAADLFSIAGAYATAVVEDLAGAPAVHRWYGAQQLDHIGHLVALVVGVPGAVQAEDEAACHGMSPFTFLGCRTVINKLVGGGSAMVHIRTDVRPRLG